MPVTVVCTVMMEEDPRREVIGQDPGRTVVQESMLQQKVGMQ